MAALVLSAASLFAVPAFADPSVTYTGSVDPAPEQGTTNWQPTDMISIGDAAGNNGTLTVAGGATMTSSTSIYMYNGSLIIDGAGTTVDVAGIYPAISKDIGTNANITISNGASLNLSNAFNASGKKASNAAYITTVYIDGEGTEFNSTGGFIVNSGSILSATDLSITNGGRMSVGLAVAFGASGGSDPAAAPRVSTITVSGTNSALIVDIVGNVVGMTLFNTAMTVTDGGEVQTSLIRLSSATVDFGGGIGDAPTAVTGQAGDLDLGASSIVNFNHTGDYKIGAITGFDGTINQINGTTIVTGDVAAGGGLNISGGVFQLGDGGTTGGDGLNATVTNDGALAVNRSDALALKANISGSGRIENDGAGTLTLTGANTYTGGTYFNAGTIAVKSNDGVLGGTSGDLHFNGGTLQNTDDFKSARAIDIAAGGATFNTDANKLLTLSGSLSGAGAISKNGTGKLELDTTGAGNTGGLAVNAGELVLNGTVGGDASVASGATLTGSGTIRGNMTIAGGAILAGNSAQTLTIDGDLTLDSGSVINAAMSAMGNTLFDVSGSAALDGTLNIQANSGFGGRVYTVVYAGGGVTDNGLTIGSVTGGSLTNADITRR